ncbi:hypothetical protein [Halopiger xanaduensis]|uniref:Uncharacterized protein n=1 Tax=Halopiger xanaduensis (strain DSM 18323 / JCM 14033 / SH-6) TaxID=797210 RepID=F8DA30_HALXS|nr:hypothetical protein [Halopiger xanaduensis]AEH36948.1 hypothetical protein Halxa_2324 [Halopiger xanaduensis SH-6]
MGEHLRDMATYTEHHTPPAWLFYLFFAIVLFFPILRVAGLPVLLPMSFSIIFLWKPINIPRLYLISVTSATIYLIGVTLFTVTRKDAAGFADVVYIIVPISIVLIIALTASLAGANKKQATYRLTQFAYLYLYFQFIIVLLLYLHPPVIDELLLSYLSLLEGNVTSSAVYLGSAFTRPGGTIINPTWVGFAVYPFARYLTTYTGRYRYVLIALTTTLLSSGRMAMITIFSTEAMIFLITLIQNRDTQSISRLLGKLAILGACISAAFIFHPFFRAYLDAFLAGDLSSRLMSYSITYRLEMYQWMFSEPAKMVRGGLVLAEAPQYIDSGMVMRTLQFGILGYVALKLPLFAFALRGVRSGDGRLLKMGIVITSVAILSSLTTTTASNMLFIPIYGVTIVASEIAFNGTWDSTHR